MSQITGLTHDQLMLLNIILASVHLLLSSIMLYLVQTNVTLPPYALHGFLVVSIVACSLIILFSVDCKNMTM